ncbi:hypothetical protein [Corynebacterium oculi]|nr:hypothetical protein [Corynebacterium oculi]
MADANRLVDTAVGTVTGQVPAPAPSLPELPILPEFLSQIQGVMPSNLLRKNTLAAGDNVEAPPQDDPGQLPVAAGAAAGAPAGVVAQSPQFGVDSLMAAGEENVIGQLAGVAAVPSGDNLGQIVSDVTTVVGKITSGEILTDAQDAIERTLASQEFVAWRDSQVSLESLDQQGVVGIDRAAAGIGLIIDGLSADPIGTVTALIESGGGTGRLLRDPVGFGADVLARVVGPEMMVQVHDLLGEIAQQGVEGLIKAAPAALIPFATAIPGILAGIPLGGLHGSGIGALAGALNPLNLLGAIPGALLGAPLGGLATGIAGLVGSLLLTLPVTVMAPLIGAAGGSVLALAAWATAVFGTYGVFYALSAGVIILGSLAAGTAAGLGGWALSLFNPFAIPFAFFFGLGVALELMFLGGLGLVITTAWIPIAIYALGFIPVLLAGMLPGLGLGTLIGLAVPLIGVPLLTALSALPGAIIGGVLGALAGWGITTLIDTLLGAGIGGVLGAILGGLLGGLAGFGAGIPVALGVAGVILGNQFGDWFARSWADPTSPLGQLRQAAEQGWNRSLLKGLVDRFADNFGRTGSGEVIFDLVGRITALGEILAFLDGRRFREMLLRGALLGAVPGGIGGGILGGILGMMAGLLNPLNLLNGIQGALAGLIPGALLGALGGGLLAPLLGTLAGLGSIPLTFLPNLALLALGLAALLTPLALAAGAATIIPPLVIATAVTFLATFLLAMPWSVPLFLLAGAMSLFALVMANPLLWIPTLGIAPLVSFIVGSAALAIATGNTLAVLGLLGVMALTVGVGTFLVTLPFFAFPALGLGLAGLASLPGLLPMALGMSLLEAIALGTGVTALSSLLTVPVGGILGGLLGAGVGGVLGTIIPAVVRAVVYGLGGSGLGAGLGAGLGGLLGGLVALLTHLRGDGGVVPGDPETAFGDLRVLNHGGFGDSLSWIPGLTGAKEPERVAVPAIASPMFGVRGGQGSVDRSLTDVTALVSA